MLDAIRYPSILFRNQTKSSHPVGVNAASIRGKVRESTAAQNKHVATAHDLCNISLNPYPKKNSLLHAHLPVCQREYFSGICEWDGPFARGVEG